MIERVCQYCGNSFKTYIAWLRNGSAGLFCSKSCQVKGRTHKAPTILTGVCKECEETFTRTKHRAGTMEYCSISCLAIARGRRMRGSEHPNWKGGVSKRPYKVRVAIEEAKKLQQVCIGCGSEKNLQGHHIIHYSKAPELADDIMNIQILCIDCHATKHPELERFILHG